ncbi:hypothetical protein [Cohnella cellulosilytica]|uniref:Uncharacterized protein n=1 Tax=Cohnella cellulosilytica TaxID=986710 RepID=A0ABW2F7T8_9BACL
MRRDTFKLLIMAGLLGFAVLYGMELSSKGIESVKGPWETEGTAVEQPAEDGDWTLPVKEPRQGTKSREDSRSSAAGEGLEAGENGEEFGIPRADREPIVDRLSGKTAEVLNNLSRDGIRMVVSLFDKVLG